MAVAVVTDSAAAIPAEVATQLGIAVVPMRFTIGVESYEEGDLPLGEVVRRFDEGIRTSGPPPGAFVEAIERADQGDGIVVLTVSSRMSSTHRAAVVAAEVANNKVRVVDTMTAAGAQGLVVLATAEAAAGGQSLDSVVTMAQRVRDRVRLVASLDTLDFLVKGGRVPDLAGRAGRHLGVRPLFEFRRGKIKPLRPALSRDGALDQLLGYWRRSLVEGAALRMVALHAMAPEAAQRLVTKVLAETQPATCLISTFGAVMVAHTGPGVTGLAWWWDQDAATGPAPSPG